MDYRRANPEGPFLKWAGGKAGLLPAYEPLFPPAFRTYHEPFLGAGAVFFHLAAKGLVKRAVLSDVNRDLVLAFRVVREHTEDLIKELRALDLAHEEVAYYAARDRFNRKRLSDVKRAAHVIYLNRTCFNGLYRVNSKDQFNVPMGTYTNPRILDEPVLRTAAETLRLASLEVADFASVSERAERGDFVYLDPPYDPISRTAKFTSYARGGFGETEQRRLADVFRKLAARGVQVMLSNHDTPLVRELFAADYDLQRLSARRYINSNASRRGGVGEVVIRNYGGKG